MRGLEQIECRHAFAQLAEPPGVSARELLHTAQAIVDGVRVLCRAGDVEVAVGSEPSGGDGHVTWYDGVDDVQAMLDRAESLG